MLTCQRGTLGTVPTFLLLSPWPVSWQWLPSCLQPSAWPQTAQGSSQLDRPTGRQMDRQTIDTQIWTEMDTWTAKHMDRDGQKDNAPSVPSG